MTSVSALDLREACFLCESFHPWTYEESDSFVAMLGLGPIGEGYSLIAAREHVASMLDLDQDMAAELMEFTERVRARLRPHYGECVVTEHGRIAPCLSAYARAFEPHCLHAHRLVFPGHDRVGLGQLYPGFGATPHESFFDAHRFCEYEGQYLYAEDADGSCEIVAVRGPVPRQFFRRLIAARIGAQERVSWEAFPSLDVVEAARVRLQ